MRDLLPPFVAFVAGAAITFGASCEPAPKPCGPATCRGCCDELGECLGGSAVFECGGGGGSCQRCAANEVCREGACDRFEGGDYEAVFGPELDSGYDADAGTYQRPDAGPPDAGFDAGAPDAGRRDAGLDLDAGAPVSFATDVLPIFETHCNACHTWKTTEDLVYAIATRTGCAGNPIVIPYNLTGGVLYGKISGAPQCGGNMPNGMPVLISSTPAAVDVIRRWILQGAKNN